MNNNYLKNNETEWNNKTFVKLDTQFWGSYVLAIKIMLWQRSNFGIKLLLREKQGDTLLNIGASILLEEEFHRLI